VGHGWRGEGDLLTMDEPWNILTASDRVLWDHSARPPKPKLATDAPADLIAFVRENREAILCAAGDRYLRTPPATWHAPSRSGSGEHKRDTAQIRRLVQYARTQGDINPEVRQWWTDAVARHTAAADRKTAPFRAASELIEWQFAHKPDPLQFILDLDDTEPPKPQPK